ncbi:MAG: glycerol-3-phosphate 1-O-acyltransferase PlsY [Dehalococcoidia bacterium]|nr:glycerol-3-phosphate 1-O-acyltransferase PlsY [Dehalococcoidia bacterium]MDW8120481.1 glycerol-3-phosphate 1-O-acyltransferase PlsY [Chloroflexota bacterium]
MSAGLEWLAVAVPVAYLWGGIPWGLLVAQATRRMDPRRYGSGSTGMTNVMRIAGVWAGLLVLALDMGKGAVAVALAREMLATPWGPPSVGLAVMVGHIWSLYLGFRGGRGTASGLGGLYVLQPWAGAVATLLGLAAIARTRYVSVGSLLGAGSGGLTLIGFALAQEVPLPYALYGGVGAVLVVWAHRPNIQRLLRGEEYRLGEPARPLAPSQQRASWQR